MRKLKLMVATLVLVLGVGAVPNFPNGTYVILGNATNWKHESCKSQDEVVVQAVATNGTILAETTVTNPEGGRNFALQIPLSTQPSAKTAQVGDTIRLWTVYGKQQGAARDRNAANEFLTVGNANSHTNVILCMVETVAFASTNRVYAETSGEVRIGKAYLDELQPWIDAYDLGRYDPDADWDMDGQSNYYEYLAGTHPLDNTDHLSFKDIDFVWITDFRTNLSSNASIDRVALTFECVSGHTYVIQSATNLTGVAWANKKVTDKAGAEPTDSAYTAVDKEDGDTVTLYMLPAVEAKREFFTVQPK